MRVYGCNHVAIEVEVELIVWLLPYREVQKVGITSHRTSNNARLRYHVANVLRYKQQPFSTQFETIFRACLPSQKVFVRRETLGSLEIVARKLSRDLCLLFSRQPGLAPPAPGT